MCVCVCVCVFCVCVGVDVWMCGCVGVCVCMRFFRLLNIYTGYVSPIYLNKFTASPSNALSHTCALLTEWEYTSSLLSSDKANKEQTRRHIIYIKEYNIRVYIYNNIREPHLDRYDDLVGKNYSCVLHLLLLMHV